MVGSSRYASALRKLQSSLPPTTSADLLLFALWTGVISGLAEAARAVWRQNLSHLPTGEFLTAEVFWMTPLAASLALLVLALIVVALDAALRARGTLHGLGVTLIAAVAGYSFLRSMRAGLADWATLLLALGFATLVARVIAARPILARRLVRITTPVMVVCLIVWAVAVPIRRTAVAAQAVSALPAPAAGAPNVLIVIWDAVRALSLSLHGYERQTTPELDRFARGGVVFERAFATAPWSLPSHASIYTGRYPTEMTAASNAPLDATHPTLAEVLSHEGYTTGGFTGNRFYGSAAFGNARGFAWYDARPPITVRSIFTTWWLSGQLDWKFRVAAGEEYAPSALRRSATQLNSALLEWIDRRGERPFFALINHFDAHDPYFPPEPFALAFSKTRPRYWLDEEHRAYSEEELRELREAYDGAVRYLDHELAELLHALSRRGLLDNTLVIVTSDHGEEFGEHGADLVAHSKSLYAPVLHVPLVIVHASRVPAQIKRTEPVSIRDIPATVMDVLGYAADHPFPGTSLLRYANGTVSAEEVSEPRLSVAQHSVMGGGLPTWPVAAGHMFSLVQGDLHYIVDGNGREQLYDLSTDIWEQRDLAGTTGAEDVLARFRATLDSIVPTENGIRPAYVGDGDRRSD